MHIHLGFFDTSATKLWHNVQSGLAVLSFCQSLRVQKRENREINFYIPLIGKLYCNVSTHHVVHIWVNVFFLWRCDPTRVMVSSFLRFLEHTQRQTTVGRTLLDEWSARRRDLYLTTHDTHNRQISMPPVGFELTISEGERPAGHGYLSVVSVVCCQVEVSATSWSLV